MGGKVFKSVTGDPLTRSVTRKEALETILWLEKITNLSLSNNMLGSTGKSLISNDIDIAIDPKIISKNNLIDILKNVPVNDINIKQSGICVHFMAPINGNGNQYVQVDFMFGDVQWLKFSFSNTSTSKYKGRQRAQLIASLAKARGYKWSPTRGLLIRKTNKFLTNTPNNIAMLLINNKSSAKDLKDVESILTKIRDLSDYDNLVKDAKETFERERKNNEELCKL